MKPVIDIFIILVLFGLFGYLHSFLASNKIKKNIAEKAGNQIAFYRIFYNVISIFTFSAFYELSPKPDMMIYELRPPYDLIIFSLQALCLFGFVFVFIQWDWKEFAGFSQISRYYEGTYNIEEMDAKPVFYTKGLYKISRHPLYMFFILFMVLRPYMDLFHMIFLVCSIIYIYIGSYFEEKKLIEKFGDEYLGYIERVPRIFPVKMFKKL
jgi:methanethiol S-methyltransferase